MFALTSRISELEEDSAILRSKVDTRYTANVLLGLAVHDPKDDGPDTDPPPSTRIRSSRSICSDLDKIADQKQNELLFQQKKIEEHQNFLLQRCTAEVLTNALKRNGNNEIVSAATAERRARGKYTPQERETIRRERNRIHAKKTRDKKKIVLEASESRIETLEREVASLRKYLIGAKIMSPQEAAILEDKDKLSQIELAGLKQANGPASDPLSGIVMTLGDLASRSDDNSDETDGVHDYIYSRGNNVVSGNTSLDTSGTNSGTYSPDDQNSESGGSPNPYLQRQIIDNSNRGKHAMQILGDTRSSRFAFLPIDEVAGSLSSLSKGHLSQRDSKNSSCLDKDDNSHVSKCGSNETEHEERSSTGNSDNE
jgi:hypothetical protein